MGGGVLLLLAGAEALVRGASALALRFGISPLVVGLTVVAIGTSSPELVVTLGASLNGQGGVAVGNVVGSNIANLGLIIGVAAALKPVAVDRKLITHDLPVMLVGMALMVVALLDGRLARWEGAVLTLGAIAYTADSIRSSRRETREAREVELPPEVEAALAESRSAVGKHALFVLGGAALLVYGANLLVDGAVETATLLGVSEAVVGLTLVALGTSLPELATTIVAAARGHGELALGNAIGSNIFNVFGVLGPASLLLPMDRGDVGDGSLAAMAGVAVLTFALLALGRRTERWKGLVLLASYVGYIAWVVGA